MKKLSQCYLFIWYKVTFVTILVTYIYIYIYIMCENLEVIIYTKHVKRDKDGGAGKHIDY
jgi:hypothetical protein